MERVKLQWLHQKNSNVRHVKEYLILGNYFFIIPPELLMESIWGDENDFTGSLTVLFRLGLVRVRPDFPRGLRCFAKLGPPSAGFRDNIFFLAHYVRTLKTVYWKLYLVVIILLKYCEICDNSYQFILFIICSKDSNFVNFKAAIFYLFFRFLRYSKTWK